MFDFAWSEFALIGVVAIIFIGPKDMPVAIRSVTNAIKKARKMASEFQTHVDDFVREADLGEVRDNLRDLRGMNVRGRILDAIDGDRSLRDGLKAPDFNGSVAPPAVRHEVPVSSLPAPPAERGSFQPAPVSPATPTEAGPVPTILPPAVARRLATDRMRRRPPAIIPPPRVMHGGRRVTVVDGLAGPGTGEQA